MCIFPLSNLVNAQPSLSDGHHLVTFCMRQESDLFGKSDKTDRHRRSHDKGSCFINAHRNRWLQAFEILVPAVFLR